MFLYKTDEEPFKIILIGLGTEHNPTFISPQTLMFAISFKLPALEYILGENISSILNYVKELPLDFWNFSESDLEDFDLFVSKSTQKINSLIPKNIDKRKQKLFEIIYKTNGNISVQEISEKVFWSSRQINRYFNQQFGISLKVFCNIFDLEPH